MQGLLGLSCAQFAVEHRWLQHPLLQIALQPPPEIRRPVLQPVQVPEQRQVNRHLRGRLGIEQQLAGGIAQVRHGQLRLGFFRPRQPGKPNAGIVELLSEGSELLQSQKDAAELVEADGHGWSPWARGSICSNRATTR